MTSASTARFGIQDRGAITPCKAADIVIFDPETVYAPATLDEQRASRPKGIRHVFLNGTHVVKDGAYTGSRRAGQVLRL
jgi:N-acyl-D-amino-acid deacylase